MRSQHSNSVVSTLVSALGPSFASAVALFLATSCAHPHADDTAGKVHQVASTPAAPANQNASAQGGGKSCGGDWECGDGYLCIHSRCVAITDRLSDCQSGRVHFDYDQSGLHPDERPSLQRIARCLKASHRMHILIDGDTDERGTIEYNLALGDRRAHTVAEYLKDLGVSSQQLSTVTYGKDRPICEEHDEACWSQNRRAGFIYKP
jgi:peptidoglycan-associated lipoprotein